MDKETKYIALQPIDFNSCNEQINLKELLLTIKKNIKILYIITFSATILAIIYSFFIAKPIYKISANVQSGYTLLYTKNGVGKNFFINPYTQKLYITNLYDKSKTKVSLPKVEVNNNKDNKAILQISIYDKSNKGAIETLNKILSDINSKESKKIKAFRDATTKEIDIINSQIISLKKYINSLQKDYNSSENSDFKINLLKVISTTKKTILEYELKIADLKNRISENNIVKSYIIGNIEQRDSPEKPKKKLIVIVTFITAILFSIFLIFFLEFIRDFSKDSEK